MSKRVEFFDNSISSPKGKQNTSCNWLGTTDIGRLVPFHVEELIPGTHVEHCRPVIDIQLLPLVAPTFGKLHTFVQYFFVPARLLADNFENVMSGTGPLKNQRLPFYDVVRLAQCYQSLTAVQRRPTYKHLTSLGLPPFFVDEAWTDIQLLGIEQQTMLKIRAYQQIWWDYFRDPEVLRDDNRPEFLDKSGGECIFSTDVQKRQLVPRYRSLTHHWISDLYSEPGITPTSFVSLVANGNAASGNPVYSGSDTSFKLRQIEALTRMSERMTLSGKRQIDEFFAQYGVKPEWQKLQMCEYVGGAHQEVRTQTLISSADTSGSNGKPLGFKAGDGYCSLGQLDVEYTAHEHGYLIGVLSIVPVVHFPQGFDRSWYRNKKDDFFQKELERVGLIAVPKKEVAVKTPGSPNYAIASNNEVFAYSQPYYDYKRGYDIIAGDFAKYLFTPDSEEDPTPAYMHAMSLYVPFNLDRVFNADALQLYPDKFNHIFYYGQGGVLSDSDDHFMVNVEKFIVKKSPADDAAVPTIETTEDPHAQKSEIPNATVL